MEVLGPLSRDRRALAGRRGGDLWRDGRFLRWNEFAATAATRGAHPRGWNCRAMAGAGELSALGGWRVALALGGEWRGPLRGPLSAFSGRSRSSAESRARSAGRSADDRPLVGLR